MSNLAGEMREVLRRMGAGLLAAIFHPNVLLVVSFAAAVSAAYRVWGRTGAEAAVAVLAFLLAMANAKTT